VHIFRALACMSNKHQQLLASIESDVLCSTSWPNVSVRFL